MLKTIILHFDNPFRSDSSYSDSSFCQANFCSSYESDVKLDNKSTSNPDLQFTKHHLQRWPKQLLNS